MKIISKQPWIANPWTDSLFILLPPFFSLLVIFLFPSVFQDNKQMPEAGWVILILLIDVAHVYSTLYRTYFDPQALRRQRFLLWCIPFVGLIVGIILYSIGSLVFWRALAYVAIYHFIRQQYGFMRVYSRYEKSDKWQQTVDKLVIYYAALYPVLYWHLKGPRNFNWFVDNDLLFIQSQWLVSVSAILYWVLILVYFGKELAAWLQTRFINLPKLAVISGTLLSWYFGIVYFNGDMAFTLLNVVSHGIPYMALVWLHGKKQYGSSENGQRFLKLVYSPYGIFLFLGIIFLFAFIEEGLWDISVWREHQSIFGTGTLPHFVLSEKALAFLVPLLAVPQITHYILDGFIWRIRKGDFKWKSEVG